MIGNSHEKHLIILLEDSQRHTRVTVRYESYIYVGIRVAHVLLMNWWPRNGFPSFFYSEDVIVLHLNWSVLMRSWYATDMTEVSKQQILTLHHSILPR